MKKFSKILSSVLTASMIASVFAVNVMAASKVHTLAVSASKTTALVAEEEIVVEVKIDNTKDLVNVDYDLVYDKTAFEVDTTVEGRNPAKFIDKTWFNDIKNADGDWQYYVGTPTINGAEAGAIYFRSAGGDNGGVEASYAVDNRVIGKYIIKVKSDAPDGTYNFTVQNGKSLDMGEVATAAMESVSVTVTVGSGAPTPVTPSIDSTTANDQTGVAVLPGKGDFKYDNAYAVSVTLKGVAGMTEAGMEFVPAFVNDWNKAAKATFDSTVLGKGDIEYKAALINIPSKYIGATFGIMARPYYVADGVKTEGDPTTKQFTYTYTGEPQ